MTKKLLAAGAVLMVSAVCFNACGDSSSSGSSNEVPSYKDADALPEECEMEVAQVEDSYYACFEDEWVEVGDSAVVEKLKDGLDESELKEELEALMESLSSSSAEEDEKSSSSKKAKSSSSSAEESDDEDESSSSVEETDDESSSSGKAKSSSSDKAASSSSEKATSSSSVKVESSSSAKVESSSSEEAASSSSAFKPGDCRVVLTGAGESKLEVIKAVRGVTGLGLKEAKDTVEKVIAGEAVVVMANVDAEGADKVKNTLVTAGATAEASCGESMLCGKNIYDPDESFCMNETLFEKGSCKITLTSYGSTKIQVIKAVQEILNITVADAKTFVEKADTEEKPVVLEDVSTAQVKKVEGRLESLGATTETECTGGCALAVYDTTTHFCIDAEDSYNLYSRCGGEVYDPEVFSCKSKKVDFIKSVAMSASSTTIAQGGSATLTVPGVTNCQYVSFDSLGGLVPEKRFAIDDESCPLVLENTNESASDSAFSIGLRNFELGNKTYIFLQLKGNSANPAPPIGPALGSAGASIMAFCKEFNALTKDEPNRVFNVVVTVNADNSFTFNTNYAHDAYVVDMTMEAVAK